MTVKRTLNATTRPQWLYSDGVLTAREVMTESDGARLAWRAAWRMIRLERHKPIRQSLSFFQLSNAVLVMLVCHHTSTFASRITNQVMAISEMRRKERSASRGYREWNGSRNGHMERVF